MTLISGLLAAVEEICVDHYGNEDVYRPVCRAAILYLPDEARAARTVIDNEPVD